ncbi:MAG: hypothetical protein NVV59_19545 [Chitinophagaceae bacterium]|nr:hypothetical protein [Chitinophagaceae bacterium]
MKEEGMMINTVGVGSAQGSKIPDPVSGGYKRDQMGNEVVSKLNETVLKEIANATNGVYLNLNDSDEAVNQVIAQLSQIEKESLRR